MNSMKQYPILRKDSAMEPPLDPRAPRRMCGGKINSTRFPKIEVCSTGVWRGWRDLI